MKLIRYEGENVTPSDDAILYRKFISDGLFSSITPTYSSGNITVPAMRGIMAGRDFTTDEETLVAPLASSGTITGQIYMEIDLDNLTYPLNLKIRNSVSSMTQQDINGSGTIYQIEIAQYTANTAEVTSVTFTAVLAGFDGAVEVINSLTSTSTTSALSAAMGKSLKDTKADKAIITSNSASTTPTVTLADNNEYIYSNTSITTLDITLASGYSAGFIASVVFVSPASAPTVTLTNTGSYTVKTKGDGEWASLVLTPTASKTVTMIFNYDGINMNVYVSEV